MIRSKTEWNPLRLRCVFSRLLVFLFLLGGALWSQAAESYQPKQGNPFTEPWRWRTMPELKNQMVFCMVEGADGSIWFGVEDGVLRYDGLTWARYNSETGDLDGKVRALCTAPDGRLYAATDQSVWFFKNGAWTRLPLKIFVHNLFPSVNGIWMGTLFGAIHLEGDHIDLYTTRTAGAPIQGVFPESTTVHFLPKDLISGETFSVSSVLEERTGAVWLVANKKVVRFDPRQPIADPGNWTIFEHGQKGLEFSGLEQLVQARDEGIIIASPAGIRRYDAQTGRWVPFSVPVPDDNFIKYPISLLQCADGTWVVGLVTQILFQEQGEWRISSQPSPEYGEPLLLETADGTLWVGKTKGNIFRVDRTDLQWKSYDGLQFQCNDIDGKAWYLSQDGGVVCQTGTQWVRYGEDDGLMDAPLMVFCAQDGTLWAAGNHQNVAATAYWTGSKWIRTSHERVKSRFNPPAVTERSDGSLFFSGLASGRNSVGLIRAERMDDGAYVYDYVEDQNGLPEFVSAVAKQPDETLIFGGNGLWKVLEDGLEELATPAGVGTSQIEVMKIDQKGQIWIAVRDAGLYMLDGLQLNHYPAMDGVAGRRLSDLLCATNGAVWASAMKGISRFDGTQWISDVLGAELPGFALAHGSLREGADGALWFSYEEWNNSLRASGLVNWAEEEFRSKTIRYKGGVAPPETGITISSKQVSPPGNVFFEWQGVSPWESTPRGELHYSWRLNKGEWSPFSHDISHLFLTLDAGSYQLEVRARDQHFNVDPTPALVEFLVLAPVWRQGWFLTMIFLFVGGLSVLGYFLIRANNRNQHFQVEQQRHLKEVEQVKLRFFTSISHELRTPLTVMLGPLESMYEKLESKELKESLRMVLRNGQRLRAMVDQILNFRKLEAGKMPIEWAKGDLVQYIQTLAEMMEPLAESRNIVYAVQVPNEACMVWFDPDKLHKVCVNLVSNALKYTPADGHVTVKLSILQTPPEKRFRFCIEDTGKGISADAQQHIFEPYYRANAAEIGTGLGLLLVKEWVDLLGGTLSVASPLFHDKEIPYGSRFIVELPLKEDPPEGADATAEVLPFEIADTKWVENIPSIDAAEHTDLPTLLLVDDNADIRQFIRSELADTYRILEAENGELGLEQAKSALPDLVISDVMMPVMDGIELCKRLKTARETSHIPVILLTARTAQEFELEGLQVGADDYVTKPFAMPLLKARIHRLLELRRHLRERFSQNIILDSFDVSSEPVDQLFLQQVLEQIERQMGDYQFGVEPLAESLGLAPRVLRYKLKAVVDQTPVALIRTLRLKRAKQLLEQPNQRATVSEIAESVGLFDMVYFSKIFKKQFGQTPSEVLSDQ